MRIAIARETDAGEPRVAATPETVKKFKALGAEVAVARGAGIASGISDAEYEAAGAEIGENVTKTADLVLKVRRPAANELGGYKQAVRKAGRLAGVKEEPEIVTPSEKRTGVWEYVRSTMMTAFPAAGLSQTRGASGLYYLYLP